VDINLLYGVSKGAMLVAFARPTLMRFAYHLPTNARYAPTFKSWLQHMEEWWEFKDMIEELTRLDKNDD
jgi:hypothetical protein